MSKNSSVTAGDPAPPPSLRTGAFAVESDAMVVETEQRIQLVDLTDQLIERVKRSAIRDGLAHVFSLHTTCALFINEAQPALHADILRLLEDIVRRDADWLHNDPQHSDCDRMNADSHLRAMVLGHGVTLQTSGGELVLGQYQRVLLGEMDGPRARRVRVQIMGLA